MLPVITITVAKMIHWIGLIKVSNLPIIKDYKKYILPLEKTIKNNLEIGKILDINLTPNYIYYDNIKNNKYYVLGVSVLKKKSYILPVKNEYISIEKINSILKNSNYQLQKIILNYFKKFKLPITKNNFKFRNR